VSSGTLNPTHSLTHIYLCCSSTVAKINRAYGVDCLILSFYRHIIY